MSFIFGQHSKTQRVTERTTRCFSISNCITWIPSVVWQFLTNSVWYTVVFSVESNANNICMNSKTNNLWFRSENAEEGAVGFKNFLLWK